MIPFGLVGRGLYSTMRLICTSFMQQEGWLSGPTEQTILTTANVPSNTEYLEHYLGNDRYFSVNRVRSEYDFSSDLRMTLDYEEDFEFFTAVFEHFYPDNPEFTLEDLIEWLRTDPSPMDINKHKTVKFTKEQLDVRLKI